MAKTAASRSTAAAMSSAQVGTSRASIAVTAEPQIAPSVAPAAMKPNRRLPCSVENTSTTVAQKIETTNRLKIESQTKKARPTQTAVSPSVSAIRAEKIRMLRMKKR
ncbi:long-subunit fatty acid transport protein [Methylorubrum pseudosasae]|nr:long-subunit fatty acid transport protein [Methylorubrum pseudosasae]